jgi:hypothetical protein
MAKKNKRWIQKAKIKKGALHRQLSVPSNKDIPVTLLKKIKRTPSGFSILNPTKTGKKRIKVTTLLKRRVNFALNVKKRKPKKKKLSNSMRADLQAQEYGMWGKWKI